MFKRFNFACLVLACIALGATLNMLFAGGTDTNSWKALERSYAAANLELAEARSAQANSQNQTVADSVSRGMLAELKAGVQVAQDRLKQLDAKGNENPYGPQIKATEDAVSLLENNYSEATKANKISAGSVPDVELRREKAAIAVAKARLSALKVLDQQPPEVRIRWELGQLQDQIGALWARPLIEN
ncbi:MAG TPA: hypothetical protein VH107_07915 [Lacipirellulaceae bacterium]|jgi:hypothetical protein|nr:hypothetical protein [Lacipirellulaceae bacterium]